jgi:hypothetical protein
LIYVPDDYQADPEQATQQLFQPTSVLVTEYARYVDAEGADFLRNYLMSLKRDWDAALTRYDQSKTRLVMEEVKELCHDLQKRISLAKQGQPIKEGQELHQHKV